jgi:hypothetical protein
MFAHICEQTLKEKEKNAPKRRRRPLELKSNDTRKEPRIFVIRPEHIFSIFIRAGLIVEPEHQRVSIQNYRGNDYRSRLHLRSDTKTFIAFVPLNEPRTC